MIFDKINNETSHIQYLHCENALESIELLFWNKTNQVLLGKFDQIF
jgi:hypothetical protein